MSNHEDGVIYLGPHKVPICIKFIGGLLCVVPKEHKSQTPIGYPNIVRGFTWISYNINHLPLLLQAAFRTQKNLKKWSALMFIMDEIWVGELGYIWETNDIYTTLERQD